ncbi:MAG: gamma carbonic anhydrase family protein [Chloroflexota bacterium]|nr:gamma carbonic anhydrase family protein [Chloroflexota bacterium]
MTPHSADEHPGAILLPYENVWPRIAADVFVAPGAAVVGNVEIAAGASIWFNVSIRGDVAPIRIGAGSSVQDNVVLHCDDGLPCVIGRHVTIGHSAIVHGATIEDGATIGMGAIVLSGARVCADAVVAAGAVVPEGTSVPAGTLVMGVPARERGPLAPELLERLAKIPERYATRGQAYAATIRELEAAREST